MKDVVVRLSSLKLQNIKNVKNGLLVMPNAAQKLLEYSNAEILGVYGQNGSGKTAIVDTLYYLQQIMIGKELSSTIVDYIAASATGAEILAEFYVFVQDVIYEVGYCVELKKEGQQVIIERETLNCAKSYDGKRDKKLPFMEYSRANSDEIFKPKTKLDELIGKNKDTRMDLIVARKLAEKSNCSYIFGESSREIFENKREDTFLEYSNLIKCLFNFALKDLFVIQNTHSGVISANFILPMAFRIDGDKTGMKGDFVVPLIEPVVLDEDRKQVLEMIVEQINTVLYTIIPGLCITIKNYGQQALDSGEEGWKMELMSQRTDVPEIPIRMESEGIIKIISILNALIQAFGNPSICLVIDELDAGIFEYMLGELLDIFNTSAKGQLIFTSHNLRALEMLDKENIMFSTVNSENRYIRMKKARDTNNLRKMYMRSITLGGQDEMIYEETDSLKIARAFRKAGRGVKHE